MLVGGLLADDCVLIEDGGGFLRRVGSWMKMIEKRRCSVYEWARK